MKITIHTNEDFTPAGKRTAKIVKHKLNGKKCNPVIRCYVSGKAYMDKSLNEYKIVNEWLN